MSPSMGAKRESDGLDVRATEGTGRSQRAPTRHTENHTTLLIAGWADTTRTAELLQPIDCQRCCWLIFIVVAIFVGLFTLLRLLANDDGLTRWPLRFLRFLFDVRGGLWEQAGF